MSSKGTQQALYLFPPSPQTLSDTLSGERDMSGITIDYNEY